MSDNSSLVQGFDEDKDDSLKIELMKTDSAAILIILNGYIDTYNSVFFQKQIGKVVSAGFTKLIFNCSNLNYVSSTGIGSFTSFLKLVKPKGGDIVLLSVQPKVYEVFQLLGFSQFFNIKETIEDAVAFFTSAQQVASGIFPKVITCPVCSRQLKATKAGRFRCADCKTIIAIDAQGQVFLG